MPTPQDPVDFAHTEHASTSRHAKAVRIARFAWDRAITAAELADFPEDRRRKLARAAGAKPPSAESWQAAVDMLDTKRRWVQAHPDHPAGAHPHADEKILWVKPPVTPW